MLAFDHAYTILRALMTPEKRMNFFPAILDIISQSVSSVSAALKCRIGNFRYVENKSALIQELNAIVNVII